MSKSVIFGSAAIAALPFVTYGLGYAIPTIVASQQKAAAASLCEHSVTPCEPTFTPTLLQTSPRQ